MSAVHTKPQPGPSVAFVIYRRRILILEALIGQIYPAILLVRLVGNPYFQENRKETDDA